jgi:hypothetical protein
MVCRADGDWEVDSDSNFEDMNAKKSSNPAKLKIINDGSTISIHGLIPKAIRLNLNFYLKDFQQDNSQNCLTGLILIDGEMELSLDCK